MCGIAESDDGDPSLPLNVALRDDVSHGRTDGGERTEFKKTQARDAISANDVRGAPKILEPQRT